MRIQHRCPAVLVAMVVVTPLVASAQAPPPPRPPQMFAAYLQGQYATLKRNIIGSADKMPAEHFSFGPTPEVMSYAALLSHIIETQYFYCSTVKGAPDPSTSLNFKVTDKAAVGQLVRDGFAYCDEVFAAVNDQNALEMLTRGSGANQRQMARVIQLTQAIVHGNEHYGNLVTYMRMKGIVPPSSTPQQ